MLVRPWDAGISQGLSREVEEAMGDSFKSMTVFTHPSGQDLVMDIFDQVNEEGPEPVLSVSHVGLGEFEVRATAGDLWRVGQRLREVTGVRVERR